ncbi:golgin IMH1-like [Nicotiana sylvestris]|uniref:golgin IMH1-like n=1 Tax=Nicotiana sylvestris TaxID=4096 RepID=UPI00388C45D8
MAPGYFAWYRRELEHERPAKRPHILNFAESSQEQWDWLAKEKGYRAEISKLKQQIEGLKFENNVQVATDLGEKNRWAQENETLRAQIQQIRIATDNQQRSRSDERLIKSLKMEISECRSESENFENTIAGFEAHWVKKTEERNQYLQQVKRDHKQTIANLKRKVATLEDRATEQARTFEAENRHCYNLLAQMEVEIQQWQNQHLQDSRILKARDDQIERLLIEKGKLGIRLRPLPMPSLGGVYDAKI